MLSPTNFESCDSWRYYLRKDYLSKVNASRRMNSLTIRGSVFFSKSIAASVSSRSLDTGTWRPRLDQPGFIRTFSLDLDCTSRLQRVVRLECFVHRTGDLNGSGHIRRLHSACHVHGITPQIIDEFTGTNHSRRDGSGVDPDANR